MDVKAKTRDTTLDKERAATWIRLSPLFLLRSAPSWSLRIKARRTQGPPTPSAGGAELRERKRLSKCFRHHRGGLSGEERKCGTEGRVTYNPTCGSGRIAG